MRCQQDPAPQVNVLGPQFDCYLLLLMNTSNIESLHVNVSGSYPSPDETCLSPEPTQASPHFDEVDDLEKQVFPPFQFELEEREEYEAQRYQHAGPSYDAGKDSSMSNDENKNKSERLSFGYNPDTAEDVKGVDTSDSETIGSPLGNLLRSLMQKWREALEANEVTTAGDTETSKTS